CLLNWGPASACNVPVFRYALERWPADPYEVIVFHRSPLGPEDRDAVTLLEKHAEGNGVPANLNVHRVDLSGPPDEEMLRQVAVQRKPELPWMVMRYPQAARVGGTIAASRLSLAAVRSLLDSPVRREMTKRITAGETAVWVLLESGDRTQDDAAAQLLQQR